jgi:TorA maturation chaperone TorD
MSESPLALAHRLEPEDQARADFYALLARLFADVPDAGLLAAIASAAPLAPVVQAGDNGDVATTLAAAWEALLGASSTVDLEGAIEEFQTLFIGVGRSEVTLYASHYLGPQSGRPLAEIRTALAGLGLARRPGSSEYEDHLAVLLETMRLLVAGDAERDPAGISVQREFFERHVASWAFDCCTAIEQSPVANYYRSVAQFSRCFLALERDSLATE